MSIKSCKVVVDSTVVSVRLDDKNLSFIDFLCKLNSCSRSEMIRNIINAYRLEIKKDGN